MKVPTNSLPPIPYPSFVTRKTQSSDKANAIAENVLITTQTTSTKPPKPPNRKFSVFTVPPPSEEPVKSKRSVWELILAISTVCREALSSLFEKGTLHPSPASLNTTLSPDPSPQPPETSKNMNLIKTIYSLYKTWEAGNNPLDTLVSFNPFMTFENSDATYNSWNELFFDTTAMSIPTDIVFPTFSTLLDTISGPPQSSIDSQIPTLEDFLKVPPPPD